MVDDGSGAPFEGGDFAEDADLGGILLGGFPGYPRV